MLNVKYIFFKTLKDVYPRYVSLQSLIKLKLNLNTLILHSTKTSLPQRRH